MKCSRFFLSENSRRLRGRRGLFTMDAAMGIILALGLLMMIAAVAVTQRRAENRLAAMRSQTRSAEAAMFALQAKQAAPAGITVERVPDSAPPGYAWVRLTVPPAANAPAVALVGLVPVQSLPEGAQP